MTDSMRRVSLTPLSGDSRRITKESNKNEKKNHTVTKRFKLSLKADDDETCAEFSFAEMIKPNNKDNGVNDEQFNDNEELEKLKQLERKFQEKYGPKKRKYGKMEDYIDKGMGYDITDPFINDEEAYDELIPSTLTTQHGGFYVNFGELEFRPLSPDNAENRDDDEDDIRPVVKRKRKIGIERRSSDELNPKSRKNNNNNNVKINASGKTVAQMLQQRKLKITNQSDDNGDEEMDEEIEEIEDAEEEVENNVVVSASVRDVVESVAKGDAQSNGNEKVTSGGSSDAEDYIFNKDVPIVKLPENLPLDLQATVDKIKRYARTSHDGKRNFFNTDINKILLDIEVKSRELPSGQRTLIYSHLASHLPCTKQTLLSRAKKVRLENEENKLQNTINEMRRIIKELEPEVIEKYQKAYGEMKLKSDADKKNGILNSDIKMPRKYFPFNDKLKALLNNAVKYKLSLYEQIGARNQTLVQDYLCEFLDNDVKPLWPNGWIGRKTLMKHLSQFALFFGQSGNVFPHHVLQNSQIPTDKAIVESDTPKPASSTISINIQKQVPPVQNVERTAKMSSDAEGLIGRFLPTNSKDVKEKISASVSITSVDLSTTKVPQTQKTVISSVNARLSPVNLKTSPNSSLIKSNSPSPLPSPLPVSSNSILQQQQHRQRDDKVTGNGVLASHALHKLIEQSLGDYPNSGHSKNTNVRDNKQNVLPLSTAPNEEMFARNFSKKESKQQQEHIVIDIASSPEHSRNQSSSSAQSQKTREKHTVSASSLTIANPAVNFMRSASTDQLKKRSQSLIAPQSAHTDMYKLKDRITPADVDQQILHAMQLQQKQQKQQNSRNRDTSLSITALPQTTTNESTSSRHPSQNHNSRYANTTTSTTPTTVSASLDLSSQSLALQLQMLSNPNFSTQQSALQALQYSPVHNYVRLPHLFASSTPSFSASTVSTSGQTFNPLFLHQYPSSHQTDGRGRTSN